MLVVSKDLSAQLIIISDGSWKSDINLVTGWETVGFNDNAWVNAISPAPYGCTPVISGTQTMWWSNSYVTDVYFRKSFNIFSNVSSATVEITADNEFYLFLNGFYVGTGNNWGTVYSFNIKPYLQCGLNVFAVHGIEWVPGTCNLVTFKATIDTTSASSLSIIPSATPALCGMCNGSATVNVSGGSGVYTFTWSSGTTSQSVTDLCAGSYNITVSDNNCNISTTSITVTGSSITAGIYNTSHVQCSGQYNGSAMALGNGGTPPYAYLWDNGQTDFIATGLCAGTYQVTATDANNCTALTTVTITEPTVVMLAASSTPTGCTPPSGTATVSVSGGTSLYTYLWNDGQTADIATGLASGSYTVTVIDANGCMDTASVTVASLSAPTITVSSITNITCHGWNDGSIAISASGYSPFIYSWSSNGGTDATAFALSTGSYTVSVTDNNGCEQTLSITTTEPSGLTVSVSQSAAILCYGESTSVTVSAIGGTPAYSGTGSFTVTAGNYSYSVSDANGCNAVASVSITEPSALIVSVSHSATILCYGDSTSVTVSAIGGTPAYSGTGGFTVTAGNYSYIVTDANGCSAVASVTITEPYALTVSASNSTAIPCFGGSTSVTVSAMGGTLAYSGTGSFIVPAGSYSYTISDANGCSVMATIIITEPLPLILNFKREYYTCAEGSASVQLTASGGTTYLWSPSAGLNDSAIANPVAIVSVNTTYTVTVSDGPCSDTAHVNIYLASSPTPPTIYLMKDTLFVFQQYLNYQWYFNGFPIVNATDSFYIATQNGTYAVMITDSIGCHSLSNGILVTDVDRITDISTINIYPNPVSSSFIFHFNARVKDAEVFIYDMLGKEMLKKKIAVNRMEIEKGNLASGVYFVRVITPEKQYIQKIVVK